MSEPQTTNPDQLPLLTAVPADWHVIGGSPGGPLQRLPFDLLLAKLIAADLVKADEATLQADLAHDEHSVALVHSDPDPLKNGWYRKTGASGAGGWVQFDTLSEGVKEAAELAATEAQTAAAEASGAVATGLVPLLESFQHLGNWSPVASATSAGNNTIELAAAADDFVRVGVTAHARASGTAKLKVIKPDGTLRSSVEFEVAAGAGTYALAIAGKAGDLIGLYGNGLFGYTAAPAAPMTPYYEYAGDTHGAVGSGPRKINRRLELSIELFRPVRDSAAEAVRDTRQFRNLRVIAGMADASLGSTLSDETRGWGDGRILPAMKVEALHLFNDRVGPYLILLEAPNAADVMEHYFEIPVQADAIGKMTLLPDPSLPWGKRLPPNLQLRPNTRVRFFCMAAGGSVSLYGGNDATVPAAAFSSRQRAAAQYPHIGALISPTYNTSSYVFAAEWQGREVVEANPSPVLYSALFNQTDIHWRFRRNAGAWVFDANGASNNGVLGRANSIEALLSWRLDRQARSVPVEFLSADAIPVVAVKPSNGEYGTAVKIDRSLGKVYVGNMMGSNTNPDYSAFAALDFPGGLAGVSLVECSMTLRDRVIDVVVRDPATDKRVTLTHDMMAGVALGLANPAQEQGFSKIGLMNGALTLWCEQGNARFKGAHESTSSRGSTLIHGGDSLVHGARGRNRDCYSVRLRNLRGAPELTARMATDIWAINSMVAMLWNIIGQMPRLQYLLIDGGTNETTTLQLDIDRYDAAARAFAMIRDSYLGDDRRGFMGIPCPYGNGAGSAGPAEVAAYVASCQTHGVRMIRYDIALSLDGVLDGNGIASNVDLSNFYDVSADPHFVPIGNTKCLVQITKDAPGLAAAAEDPSGLAVANPVAPTYVAAAGGATIDAEARAALAQLAADHTGLRTTITALLTSLRDARVIAT